FYISSTGSVNVHKPGDYISKMIELAGARYVPTADDLHVEENALSTMNMQMEAFYAAAKDADYIIYNSAIDGELDTINQLLAKSSLLADFKAVKEGNVWCTEKNMFQQTTGAADMIADLHAIVTGEANFQDQLTFLHRLQ
ncbi:MAG: ABC transporter substrate-binding protein, partial [Eubacteriales bacterium]|nr:ABC transporter substrate-binding protein [Eubacteriales bacterium]